MLDDLFVRRFGGGGFGFDAVRRIEEGEARGVAGCGAQLLVERVTEGVVIAGSGKARLGGFVGGEDDETVGLRQGEWAQEGGIDDGVDGGVRADGEPERSDGGEGEDGVAEQAAPGVADILQGAFEGGP